MKALLNISSLARVAMLCALALATVATHPAAAQGEAPPREIQYRFAAFGTGVGGNLKFTNIPGGKTEIPVRRGFVTNFVKTELRERVFLDFFKEGNVGNGENPPKPDLTVRIPETAGREILVLVKIDKDEAGEVTMEPMLVDFRQMKLGLGDQLIFNDLPVALGTRFTNAEGVARGDYTAVANGKWKLVAGPRDKKCLREFAYFNPNKKQWDRFISSLYFKDEEAREVIFCYLPKGAARPVVETLSVHEIPFNLVVN